MSTTIKEHLWQCDTRPAQIAWIERALRAGRVLTDSGLWLGGVDRPQDAIASLRKAGVAITTTRKRVVDAADEVHNDLAWKLTV